MRGIGQSLAVPLVMATLSCSEILGVEERELRSDGGAGAGAGGAAGGAPSAGGQGGSGGSGVACPLSTCDGECVDTLRSTEHCGACDNACAGEDACLAGVCDRHLRGGRGSFAECVRVDTGMKCRGTGAWGELGNGEVYPDDVLSWIDVTLVPDAIFAANSARSTCFLTQIGEVRCVGSNLDGELGIGTTDGPDDANQQPGCCHLEQPVAPLLPRGSKVLDLAAGGFWPSGNFYCALLENGDVYCWGTTVPSPLKKLENARQIEAGNNFACALLDSGEVWCWGTDADDVLNPVAARPPSIVEGLPPVRAIGSARDTVYAVAGDGRLFAWGANSHGQLGPGATVGLRYYPAREIAIELPSPIVQVAGAGTAVCVLLADGTVRCWGEGGYQGDGTPPGGVELVPHQVPLADVVELAANTQSYLARTRDGAFYHWGYVTGAQLALTPIEVP
ncbi:MAG: hypothetical protein IPM79_35665 [Polyangiaceae bacterium]|nr:hypothetical protein [Polyangiaceae bacterium]MBK8942797.1 hypothetical protein [Polyangiaceae bacterium]